jgi:FtsP/CotA-like multicopper oxidase with cupredoxin domain
MRTSFSSSLLSAAFFVAAFGTSAVHAVTIFNVSATSTAAYTIDGAANPTLTLIQGQTYQFKMVNLSAIHPFFIKFSASVGTAGGLLPADGLDLNGQTGNVTMTYVVPATAPAQVFYNCSNHPLMTGTINILKDNLFVDGFE